MLTREFMLDLENFFPDKTRLSSSEYGDIVDDSLGPIDACYTYLFRLPRLLQHDMDFADGLNVNTQGDTIDCISQHAEAAVVVTTVFAAVSLIKLGYNVYKKRQANRFSVKSSECYIFQKLSNQPEKKDTHSLTFTIDSVNDYLLNRIKEKSLQEKYRQIKIIEAKDHNGKKQIKLNVVFNDAYQIAEQKQKPASSFVEKIISPIWRGLSLASFLYWILWIGTGVFTGNFAPVGISELSWAAFAFPLAVGAAYPLLKLNHFFQNKTNKNDQEKLADLAKNDTSELFSRFLINAKFDLAKKELIKFNEKYNFSNVQSVNRKNQFLGNDISLTVTSKSIELLTKKQKKKTAMAFLSGVVSGYVGAQYISWIVTDCIQVARHITELAIPVVKIISSVLLCISVVYAAYSAYKRFYKIEQYKLDFKPIPEKEESLDAIYQHKKEEFKKLLTEVRQFDSEHESIFSMPRTPKFDQPQFFNNLERNGPTKETRVKKIATRAWSFLNNFMTGAFVARIFLVSHTVTFVPSALVATLSVHPLTLCLIAAVGIAWGAYKCYQYCQDRKEEQAKEYLEQQQLRKECLINQIELTDLKIHSLQERRDYLSNKYYNNKATDEPVSESKFQYDDKSMRPDETSSTKIVCEVKENSCHPC